MNVVSRHIRWFFCMAVALLCFVVCHVSTVVAGSTPAENTIPTDEGYETVCSSFSEKEDDMSHAIREMGQWGIPSASVTVQGTAGRMHTLSEVLQRINRLLGTLLVNEQACANGLADALHHALSTKRFNSGYYIYYRCQMRC